MRTGALGEATEGDRRGATALQDEVVTSPRDLRRECPGECSEARESVPSFVPSFALGRAVSGWDTLCKMVSGVQAKTASELHLCVHSASNGTVKNFRFVRFLNRVSQVRILPGAPSPTMANALCRALLRKIVGPL